MPAPYPILYSFRRCPYAMRARLALAVSGMVCELREVVLAQKPQGLLQASPKGTVPVLIQVDGSVLEQSLDIMLWALRGNDPLHWLPGDEASLQDAMRWISQSDGPFKRQLDGYKYPQRHGLPDGLEYRTQGACFLNRLNLQLLAHGFLAGKYAGLADMAIAPFVRQFAHVDPVWFANQDWPALQHWLTAFETSALFEQVMGKYAAWHPEQPAVMFPTPGPTTRQEQALSL